MGDRCSQTEKEILMKRVWSFILTVALVLSLLPMGVLTLTASAARTGDTMSAYADMRLTEICFKAGTKWNGSVYRSNKHSKDNPYVVTFDYHLTGGRVTFDSIAGLFTRLEGSSTTLQTGRHTFSAQFYTTADQNTFAPRLTSTASATLYMWNFSCTLGGTKLSGTNEGYATTAAATEATVSGFSWYDGEVLADEQPVTENTAVLYNEKHSLYDKQAEEMRLGIVNAEDDLAPSATGKTYYVSSSGSNKNDGLSPQTAWRNTEAVAAHSFQLSAGDVVLFERGGVYRGSTRMVSGVSYGAYGEGSKPCLYASPRNYADASLWERYKTNVWRVDVRYIADIGNIVFEHGEVCASDYKICDPAKMTVDNLKKNYQYYHDLENGYLYMYYYGGNPGEKFESIEICPKTHVFGMVDSLVDLKDVTIDNLCIKYTGAHGLAIGKSENITVTNCEIGYIGGSLQNADTRYGNGIEFYSHVTGALIENNWIYQCFDAGYTNQGGGNATHRNITVKNNLIEYCNYNIEIFTGSENGLIKDCVYEDNLLRFAGYGFGTKNRYGSNDSATSSICYWRRAIPSENVVFRNNILDTSYRFLVVSAYVNDEQNRGPTFTDNVWVQHDGPKSAVALQVDTDVSGWKNHDLYELPATDLATMKESVSKIDLNPTAVIYDVFKLDTVEVNTLPTKTKYLVGETVDTSGLTLKLTYKNGSTAIVSDGYTIGAVNNMTVGKQTVSVSYDGFKTSFEVMFGYDVMLFETPQDVTAVANSSAQMSVFASGTDLQYQWQVKTSPKAAWKNTTTSGYKTYKITIKPTVARNGYQYRCVITDFLGGRAISPPATLTVTIPKITTQPKSVTVASGKTATVTFKATGVGLTYKWYYKNKGATKFSLSTSCKSSSYKTTMNTTRAGRQVYCVVTDKYGNSVKTNTVTLGLKQTAKITTQPKSVTVASGKTATVTFKATGDGLTYKWYYKNKGATKFTYTSSFKSNTYKITMNADRAGRQVYCVVTDKYGNSVKTNTVTLGLKKTAKITTQPKSVTVASGKTATVTFKATGDGLTYKWYYKNKGATKFTYTSSFKSNTYKMTMNATRAGRQVYCVVTDKYGNSVKTNTVTLKKK